MKKLARLLTLISCFAAIPLFFACTDDDDDSDNSSSSLLIGSWKYNFSSGYVLLTFDKDGYMTYYEKDGAGFGGEEYCKYTYKNNILTIFFYDEEDNDYYEERIEVETLNKEKLVLKNWPDGGLCVFIRQ